MELKDFERERKILVIFGGGFHPFHRGHFFVYQYLKDIFPSADVFVVSTNNTTTRPFSFKEKKFLAIQAGIPSDRFVEVKSPYKADEVTKNYNSKETVLIFALGEKDKQRLSNPIKKDGTLSYLQPLPKSIISCDTFDKHAYYVVVPTVVKIDIDGNNINSGTTLRKLYTIADESLRNKIVNKLYPSASLLNKHQAKEILDNVLKPIKLKEGWFQSSLISDEERERIFMELIPYFNIDKGKMVPIKIDNEINKNHLGSTKWAYNKSESHILGITINSKVARDKFIYKSVLAHELCHVEDLQKNIFPKLKAAKSKEEVKQIFYEDDIDEGHSPSWTAIASRINTKFGKNFVTRYSDARYSIFGNIKRNNIKEHIVKLKNGKYRLLSHIGKNLGTFDSHSAAAKHEGEIEYFKSLKEAPDFGYKRFNNRDADIANLKWIVEFVKDAGIIIKAIIPARYAEKSYSIHGNYEGMIIAKPMREGNKLGLQITSSRLTPNRNWQATGLGQMLYDRLIQESKKYNYDFIMSDFDRSQDANKAWKKLSNRYDVEKVKSHDGDTFYRIDLD
jgi:hypothetical protein